MAEKLQWQILLKLVVAELKRGPKRREQIIAGVKKSNYGGSNKSIDRMLEALLIAELVAKSENGTYEWVKDYDELRIDQIPLRLEHSKVLKENLMETSKTQKDFSLPFSFLTGIQKSEYFKYFHQHLEDGYPTIFDFYEKWENINKKNEDFNNEVERISADRNFIIAKSANDMANDRAISVNMFASIKKYIELISGGELKDRVDLKVEDGIFDPITKLTLAKNEAIKEELEKFIHSCVSSESVKKLYDELEIEEAQEKIGMVLEKEILDIFKAVDLGFPLRGYCEHCKIYLKEKNSQK